MLRISASKVALLLYLLIQFIQSPPGPPGPPPPPYGHHMGYPPGPYMVYYNSIFSCDSVDCLSDCFTPFEDRCPYKKDYVLSPVDVGLTNFEHGSYDCHEYSNDFAQVTAQVVEIPGEGFITSFSCPLKNPDVPAKYGVLEKINANNVRVKCLVEAIPDIMSTSEFDYVPLLEPCHVECGDLLVIFGPSGRSRCEQINYQSHQVLVDEVDYSLAEENLILQISDFAQVTSAAIAFTAKFDAGQCGKQYYGSDLADREKSTPSEDVIYIDKSRPIHPGAELKGVAVYIENPGDYTGRVEIVDYHGYPLCPYVEIDACTTGVNHFYFPVPCDLCTTGYIKLDTHARTERSIKRNVLSYSYRSCAECHLEVNGREKYCNREYSIQVFTENLDCLTQVEPKTALLPNDCSCAPSNDTPPQCPNDYTGHYTNWNPGTNNAEFLTGPLIYVDTVHPLRDGRVKKIAAHFYTYADMDSIYVVVWRQSKWYPEYYRVICSVKSPEPDESGWIHAYLYDDCFAEEGDFVGFIYTGNLRVPVSHEQSDSCYSGYLSVINDQGLMTVLCPYEHKDYAFEHAMTDYIFNIYAEECTVECDSSLNHDTQFDDIPCDYYAGNELYDRLRSRSDAFFLVDETHVVPFDGHVSAMHLYDHYCPRGRCPILMMVRPKYDHYDKLESVEVICSVEAPKWQGPHFDIDGPCKVKKGDLMAISVESAWSRVSYDKVDCYKCSYLNSLLENNHKTCNRKYSMGFTFQKSFEYECYGPSLVDCPYDLHGVDDMIDYDYVYTDETTMLPDGQLLAYYDAYIEGPFEQIEFSLVNMYGSERCSYFVDWHDATPGLNHFDVSHFNCIITADEKIRVYVHEGLRAFGLCCDPDFTSILMAEDQLSSIAELCGDNIRLSVSVRTVDPCAQHVEDKEHKDCDFKYVFPVFYETLDREDYDKISECDKLKAYGPDVLRIGSSSSTPMVYIDTTSEIHQSGYLKHWNILVDNKESPLLPVVFRQFGSTPTYYLTCWGFTDDNTKSEGVVETIYPSKPCKVEEGDFIGFIASNSDCGETIRVGHHDEAGANSIILTYPDFYHTQILPNGIYSVDFGMEKFDVRFNIQAKICEKEYQQECLLNEEISEVVELNDQTIGSSDSPQIVYVDLREGLPAGKFLYWSYIVAKPYSAIYPIVWKKIDSSKFEVACYAYDSDPYIPEGLRMFHPSQPCHITDEETYYVGFIAPYAISDLHQMINYDIGEPGSSLSLINTTFQRFNVHKGQHYILEEDIDDTELEIDRNYKISGNVCKEEHECIGDTSIVNTSEATTDRVFLIEKFPHKACLKKITINSIRSSIDFRVVLFEPSDVLDANSQTMTLINSVKLRTSGVGLEEFNLSGLCGNEDTLIGFAFVNRRMPFRTSVEEDAPVQYIASNSNENQLDNIGQEVTFFRNLALGKTPVEFCFTKYLTLGNYLLHDQEVAENVVSLVDNSGQGHVRFSVLENQTINLESTIVKFGAYVHQPGDIHFLEVAKTGELQFEIMKIWNFTAHHSGWNHFSIDTSLYSDMLSSNSYLAVASQYEVLYYTLDTSGENQDSLQSKLQYSDIMVGAVLDVDFSNFVPYVGARLDVSHTE